MVTSHVKLVLWACGIGLASSMGCSPCGPATANMLTITGVNVVDVVAGRIQTDRTVRLQGNRIVSVGKNRIVGVSPEGKVIDGRDKYLIPGLWDMHVHWYEKDYLPLYLVNGITGIRMMSGDVQHVEWKREIEKGNLLGPRIILASGIVDGPDPVWPGSVVVENEEQARQAVRRAKADGAAFVKVYVKLSRTSYLALADECSREGIPFAGHVPYAVTVEEACSKGQKSIEHLSDFIRGCSKDQEQLQKELIADRRSVDRVFEKGLDSFDPDKANRLYKTLATNQTWICPTLNYYAGYFLGYREELIADARLRYIPGFLRDEWLDKRGKRLKLYSRPEDEVMLRKLFDGCLSTVRRLKEAGLSPFFLAGTDSGNPFCLPAFSLHDELRLLVQAGLTPAEALRASTCNAAGFLGIEKSCGTVEEGKLADLVLLDGNPLEDIGNTNKISAVVFNGTVYAKSDLETFLAQVKAVAGK